MIVLLGANPIILSRDLIGQRFLKVSREDAPGVGLDLEVRTGFWKFGEVGEGGFGMIESGREGRKWCGIEGDVKMDAALCGGGFTVEFGKVFEAGQGLGVENDLVKIGGLIELLDGSKGFFVLRIEGEGV